MKFDKMFRVTIDLMLLTTSYMARRYLLIHRNEIKCAYFGCRYNDNKPFGYNEICKECNGSFFGVCADLSVRRNYLCNEISDRMECEAAEKTFGAFCGELCKTERRSYECIDNGKGYEPEAMDHRTCEGINLAFTLTVDDDAKKPPEISDIEPVAKKKKRSMFKFGGNRETD